MTTAKIIIITAKWREKKCDRIGRLRQIEHVYVQKKRRKESKNKKNEHGFSTTTRMMMENNSPFNSALTQLTSAEKRRWTAVKHGFTDKMV